mgnify:CR=1 FL=1
MAQRILIMGLPGAGKTYLAQYVLEQLQNAGKTVTWLNADDIRAKYNDWDFSQEGRIRQSKRMRELADAADTDYAMCDFVAPLVEMRNNFKADWTIWIDTIDRGRFEDTNRVFVPPEIYDFRITEQRAEYWAEFVGEHIVHNRRRPQFDWQQETVQMLGRWQPWHAGHRKLFDRAIAKTGQVCIMIRDCEGWNDSNPFKKEEVENFIENQKKKIAERLQQRLDYENSSEFYHCGNEDCPRITFETALEQFFKCPRCNGVVNLKKNDKLKKALESKITDIRNDMRRQI